MNFDAEPPATSNALNVISAPSPEFDIDNLLETSNAFLQASEKFQKEEMTIRVLEQMLNHLLVKDTTSTLAGLRNMKTLIDLKVLIFYIFYICIQLFLFNLFFFSPAF